MGEHGQRSRLGASYQPEGVAQLLQPQTQQTTEQAPAVAQTPAKAVSEPEPIPKPRHRSKPATASQKPTAKSSAEIKKEQEDREIHRAKKTARAYIDSTYATFMGWGKGTPKVIENGKEWETVQPFSPA